MARNRSEKSHYVVCRKMVKPGGWDDATEVRLTRMVGGDHCISVMPDDDRDVTWVEPVVNFEEGMELYGRLVDGFLFADIIRDGVQLSDYPNWEGRDAT